MFKRVLIANRGEIALRVVRACREMGIESVMVYSTADADSLPVQLATQAVCIGPPPAKDSYLNMEAVITVALQTGCEALHPGYGFLSENDVFSDMCRDNGIVFIGPSGDVIRSMGNKASARSIMQKSGVPVVPGSDGIIADAQQAMLLADKIGYPVLIKASAGGGGRGMRAVFSKEELAGKFTEATQEALSCFGNGEVYMEKLILNPRHIEVQVLASGRGEVVHLGERECSIQRKNQKMIEESPAKGLPNEVRESLGRDAVAAAKAVDYCGAGTIEFVMDKDNNYYFIEMNTRIQVEHPVTEMVTGIDLVRSQIEVAAGLGLKFSQQDIKFTGHAIECRINAEDPFADFAGRPGTTEMLHLPGGCGVRVDSALYTGYTLSPYYDSMVAKLIVHAPTRLLALRRMRRALEELVIEGYPTTAEFLHEVMHHPDFVKGRYDTGFIEKNLTTVLGWCETR